MQLRQKFLANSRSSFGYRGDGLRFLSAWLVDPLQTAAIAPSGRQLARLITQEIGPQASPVLELGPGTGAFTRALMGRAIPEHELTLVEMSSDFAEILRRRFPHARVIEANAASLSATTLFPERLAGAAVSGLGLLSMHPRTVRTILRTTFNCLRLGGCFYQFTYGLRCPVPKAILDRLGLKAERIGGTWANLPPATVYRISRRSPPIAASDIAVLGWPKTILPM